jgi:hypothetical protein
MLPDKEIMCHRTGFTKSCRSIVAEGQCQLWMNIIGLHPQTGEQINQWKCADAWLPLLMIENSKMQRETGAAVESFRNEMVLANERTLLLTDGGQP